MQQPTRTNYRQLVHQINRAAAETENMGRKDVMTFHTLLCIFLRADNDVLPGHVELLRDNRKLVAGLWSYLREGNRLSLAEIETRFDGFKT